ncbi:MAG: hypothetical protein ABFS08_01850 [Pseudomonadota bacterium]
MKPIPLLLFILLTLLQTGCIPATSYIELKPQLEQWEKDREYGQALQALGQIDPKDPDYTKAAQVRKQVEKRASDYEQLVRKETYKKQKKGDWAAALDQYDEALRKHPRSVVIKDGLAKLHQQQRETINKLEHKRLIQHGEWLRDVLPVYLEGARVDPRNSAAQDRLKRIISEAEDISGELALLGNKAMADNDIKSADTTLTLAFKLNDDPVIEESLKTLRAKQRQANKKYRETQSKNKKIAQTKQKKRKRTIRAITKRYDKAFAKQDFLTAKKLLNEIEKTDRSYNKLSSMKRTLQKAIDTKVSRQFDAGVSAYSRGLFEKAASEWRNVLKLNSSHQQAKENLERAEKVLEKIERLKSKQEN